MRTNGHFFFDQPLVSHSRPNQESIIHGLSGVRLFLLGIASTTSSFQHCPGISCRTTSTALEVWRPFLEERRNAFLKIGRRPKGSNNIFMRIFGVCDRAIKDLAKCPLQRTQAKRGLL